MMIMIWGLEELEIGGKIDTIEIMVLRSVRILRIVPLETLGDFMPHCEKLSANTCGKKTRHE